MPNWTQRGSVSNDPRAASVASLTRLVECVTTVLKLGGSVVTRKDDPETVDDERLDELASAVANVDGPLVVVHGGGSFGHHYAAKHEVSVTAGTTDPVAVREIHAAMGRLNEAVVDTLAAHDVPGLPVHPLSIGSRDHEGVLRLPTDAIERQLLEGFVPVLHGDVVAHVGEGATVLSGDELVVHLANALDAERVGVCSTVPGVLDGEGAVIARIETLEDVRRFLGASESTDVTGGMTGKVEALLELDVVASVFGPESIDEFVAGGTPGTTVDGRTSR